MEFGFIATVKTEGFSGHSVYTNEDRNDTKMTRDIGMSKFSIAPTVIHSFFHLFHSCILKPCPPHCRRKRRLSQSATVAEKCDCRRKRRQRRQSATVAFFCDSRRFRRIGDSVDTLLWSYLLQ